MSKGLKKDILMKQTSLLHYWLVKHFINFGKTSITHFPSISLFFLEGPPGKLAEALA
jgi:hypothetical protein